MFRFLVIQTAFTGDVVLATALIEKLHTHYPDARIDFLLRKGNEGLLQAHPYLTSVLVWDKKQHKQRNLMRLAGTIRRTGYTHVINAHRFAASGILTMLSGAGYKAGFDKNPFAFTYTRKVTHEIATAGAATVHELWRNQQLIADITDNEPAMPCLYPSADDYNRIATYKSNRYICIAPSSVWFTKQFPEHKWSELLNELPASHTIYLIGAPSDKDTATRIIAAGRHKDAHNLCGQLSFLQSAALMQGAEMNYTNDSAPLHFASAMNAPVTAVFCSTVPYFGFGPVRANGCVVATKETLPCRPCGLHGHKACPEGHFRCAETITNEQLLWWTSNRI